MIKDHLKAIQLGSKGGRKRSISKRLAARINGRKGGRPRRTF